VQSSTFSGLFMPSHNVGSPSRPNCLWFRTVLKPTEGILATGNFPSIPGPIL
jgi:hypothetical protein